MNYVNEIVSIRPISLPRLTEDNIFVARVCHCLVKRLNKIIKSRMITVIVSVVLLISCVIGD